MSSDTSTGAGAEIELSNPYGDYIPSLPTAIVFMALFSLSSIVHLVQIFGSKPRRMPWMVVFPICGFVEVIGWAGRLWSHFSIYSDGYLMQICCLVIAPTFMSAGLYMLLGVMIQRIAPHQSYLSGKWFKIIFIIADIVSLVIQAVGGGMAATAVDQAGGDLGGRIMLAGIVVQLVVMIIYSFYGLWWAYKARAELRKAMFNLPNGRGLFRAAIGMVICSIMIILRGFWRSAELGDGFSGSLAENEGLFLLDGVPVAIAMLSINLFHPNRLFACLDTPYNSASSEKSEGIDLEERDSSYPPMSTTQETGRGGQSIRTLVGEGERKL